MHVASINGDLTACVVTRAFGITMTSPPIRVTGPIHLGIFNVQVVLAITNRTFGRGTIDFVVQVDLVNDEAFVPHTRIPVHIDVTQLTVLHRAGSTPRAPLSSGAMPSDTAKPVAVCASSHRALPGDRTGARTASFAQSEIAHHPSITRTHAPQIGPQRGCGNVFVVGWPTNDESDFDFVLHVGNHFSGGEIDWKVEGIVAGIVPFSRGTNSSPPHATSSRPTKLANAYDMVSVDTE